MKKNLYGTRKAAENWFNIIEDEGFKQNKVDPCNFVRNNCIFIRYVNYCCIVSKYKETIDALLKNISKKFMLIDDGGVKSYIGMNVSKDPNENITMSQPAIIDRIFNSLGICNESKMHDTTANVILTRDGDGNRRKQ